MALKNLHLPEPMMSNLNSTGVLIAALCFMVILNQACASAEVTSAEQEPDTAIVEEGEIEESPLTVEFEPAYLDSLFDELGYADEPGLVAAVYEQGEMIYQHAQGFGNLDHEIALTESSRFYMASLSKQVTAAAAGVLIHRDSLRMEDEVADYFEDWPDYAAGVQVQHLIYHTSGLPELYDLINVSSHRVSDPLDIEDYLELIFKAEELNHDPGEEFNYTNSGYTVLAALIEKISGQSLDDFASEALFDPLGMGATHFHTNWVDLIPNRALSYEPVGNGFRQTYMNTFQGYGPGGLYSTLTDWQKWEQFRVDEDPLGKGSEFHELLTTSGTTNDGEEVDYGFGLRLNEWKGQQVFEHTGSFMGFRHSFRHFPEYGLTVLVLGNRGDLDREELTEKMAEHLLNAELKAWMQPYTGEFHNDELDVIYSFTTKNGRLYLDRPQTEEEAVNFEETDKWSVGSWDIVFLDENGRKDRFKLSTGRTRDVEFIRRD